MVRFSFFQTNNSSNKLKKMVQSSSSDAIAKNFQDDSQNLASKQSSTPTSSNLLLSKAQSQQINYNQNPGSNLAVVGRAWSSVDLKGKFDNEFDREVHPTRNLKKCQSFGSGLDQEEMFYTDNLTYGDRSQRSSYDTSNSHQYTIPGCKKDQEANSSDFYKNNLNSEFRLSSDLGNYGSIFSIGDPIYSGKDVNENSDIPAGDSTDCTPDAPSLVARSCSLPNIGALTLSPGKCSCRQVALQSTSSEDLYVLDMNPNDKSIDESDNQAIVGQPKENFNGKTEKNFIDSSFDDACDSRTLSGLAKDWAMPDTDGRNDVKALQGEPSVRLWDEMHNSDFKIKRIEEWVTDLQHCGPLEETIESSMLVDPLTTDANTTDGLSAAKADSKVTPSMEAAKRYMSSPNANVSAVQLANHGLVVIPFLSAFASLKVLNLSGNAIVKITSGALPRGLHILNLSKNSISTIEGLRELTRLRVLDLSYNRIFRIGHGLASCSSLKELYLAGNKISEVEGLHRLLKLSVLDLRFNKISTAKSLGQLASNYNSLQAISLEGNPAQKNVGDDQVKKYLQSLLPHLAYYNRQHILKDGADRSIRLGMSSHQFDRSLRSDHKNARKSSLGSASRKTASSTTVARRSQAVVSPKRSKGRQGHLPPIGTRAPNPSPYHFDFSNKLSNFKTDLSMRRSRSEGTIGVL